jgi:hypothetical protein
LDNLIRGKRIIMLYGKCWVFISFPLLISTLAVHTSVALVFADDPTASASSYRFITIDIPTPAGQLGFTSLGDINEKGEITGGSAIAI